MCTTSEFDAAAPTESNFNDLARHNLYLPPRAKQDSAAMEITNNPLEPLNGGNRIEGDGIRVECCPIPSFL